MEDEAAMLTTHGCLRAWPAVSLSLGSTVSTRSTKSFARLDTLGQGYSRSNIISNAINQSNLIYTYISFTIHLYLKLLIAQIYNEIYCSKVKVYCIKVQHIKI